VGLTLALELNHHGLDAVLVERNPTTTRHPKMDMTNGAVPADHPLDVAWVTRLSERELARFAYPSMEQRYAQIRELNDGTTTLEPPVRVSQVVIEPALKCLLESRADHIDIRFGWALDSFTQDADGVHVVIRATDTGETRRIRTQFLAGCDGAGSSIRKGLGIQLDEIDMRYLLARKLGIRKLVPALARAYRTQSGRIPQQGSLRQQCRRAGRRQGRLPQGRPRRRQDGEHRRRRFAREILDLGTWKTRRMASSSVTATTPHRKFGTNPEPPQSRPCATTRREPGSERGRRARFLEDGRAIFDLFGKGFTLLRFTDIDVAPIVDAATDRAMPLDVVDIRDPHARRLYQRDLVLIRPDQHVAWRSSTVASDPLAVIDCVRGDWRNAG
jgi:hypothetical protein